MVCKRSHSKAPKAPNTYSGKHAGQNVPDDIHLTVRN
jgi:hypothetical protein